MPSEDEATRRWLRDLHHNIGLASQFVAGMDEAQFAEDVLRLYAVMRRLEIISEASRRLPEALKQRHPAIAWPQMAAAGNVYRHQYEDVAPRIVWRTLLHDLPELLAVVEAELARLDPDL